MFPLIALIPIIEGALGTAAGATVDVFLTETGLTYDVEAGIAGVNNGINSMQAGISGISNSISNVQTGISSVSSSISTAQIGIDTINNGMSHQAAMLSSIQSSIGVLGAASVIGCTLSAINVYQLAKVRSSLNRIEDKVENGFLDLKDFFQEKLQYLIDEQEKQRLSQAYSYYLKGLERLKTSLLINNSMNRSVSLGSCVSIFTESLSIYDDRREYENVNIPAKLRRLECCWTLESAIAETYFLQGEYNASRQTYENLYKRIVNDINMIMVNINQENYLFILGDLNWIFKNDLPIIKAKITLIKNYQNEKVFQPVALKISNSEQDQEIFEPIPMNAAKLYLECLLSDDKTENIKNAVVTKKNKFTDLKYRYINFDNLPLIHLCDLHIKSEALDGKIEKPSPIKPEATENTIISYIESMKFW